MTEKEQEQQTEKRPISREEFFLSLEQQIDNISSAILNLQLRLASLIQLKQRILETEELGLRVSFYEQEGQMFFEARPKREFGFEKGGENES